MAFILSKIDLIWKGNHSPAFKIYCEKPHGFYCYCLNRHQLGQYWRCIVEDCEFVCPSKCRHCSSYRETFHIFVELLETYFLQPNIICGSASDDKPLQPVMWRVFNRNINKNNTFFKVEIAKSIPHIGIVTNYGQTY